MTLQPERWEYIQEKLGARPSSIAARLSKFNQRRERWHVPSVRGGRKARRGLYMITYLIIVINHQKRRNIRDLTESRERGFASPPHLFASSPTNRSNYQLQFFPLLYKCLAPSNAAPVRRHENGHQERKEEKNDYYPRHQVTHMTSVRAAHLLCSDWVVSGGRILAHEKHWMQV